MVAVTVDGRELSAAVATVARAAGTRSAVPILTGVRVDWQAFGGLRRDTGEPYGGLRLTATDLAVTCSVRVGEFHEAEPFGSVIVSATALKAACKVLTGTVEVQEDGKVLHVGPVSLPSLADVQDWPVSPPVGDDVCTVDSAVLAGLVGRVGLAVSRYQSRPVLCGVLVETGPGDVLRMTETDSYRLAHVETSGVLVRLAVGGPSRPDEPSAEYVVNGCTVPGPMPGTPDRPNLEGEPTGPPIGFNAAFLRDGARLVVQEGGDTVTLRLRNPLRPVVMSNGRPDCWYLLMPIRLGG